MNRSDKNGAFDVHQATVVVLVQDGRGRTLAHSVLPTQERAVLQFVGGMRGRISVVFEEGTHAQWLHDLLLPVVDRVVVCDRRGEPRHGNKSDLIDVIRLADGLRAGTLRAVYTRRCPIRRAGFALACCTPSWTCSATFDLARRRPWRPRPGAIRRLICC